MLEGWDPVNRFGHTGWVAVVAPTGRPGSVPNRPVTEVLVAFSLCRFAFSHFVGVGAFVMGLSQNSSFFSCSPSCFGHTFSGLHLTDLILKVFICQKYLIENGFYIHFGKQNNWYIEDGNMTNVTFWRRQMVHFIVSIILSVLCI